MRNTAAMVLAGGINLSFSVLTHNRAKSALPIAGHLRIIDFVLSSLSKTGIPNVGVLLQYLPGSLIDHIGVGHPWDLDSSNRKIKLMPPFVGMGKTKWFRGSADAVFQNMDFVFDNKADQVLILTGDHIYGMNFGPMIEQHRQRNADMTILTTPLPTNCRVDMFGCVQVDKDSRVTDFIEKPPKPVSDTISTGVYLFRTEVLYEMLDRLREDIEVSHNLPTSVIEPLVQDGTVYAHPFEGPWEYLPDLPAYVDYHRRLLRGESPVDPNNLEILTNLRDRDLGSRPSPYFGPRSDVRESLVAPGCVVEGRVVRSVLSPGVRVGPGALVQDSIVFHDSHIAEGAQLKGVLADKDTVFQPECQVGEMPDDPAAFDVERLTVVGKGAQIQQGIQIGGGEEIPLDQVVNQDWAKQQEQALGSSA